MVEAGAEGQQVEATEQEADPHQGPQHPEQAERFHREDHQPQHQGHQAVGETPAPALHVAVGQGHDAGHGALQQEHNADRKRQRSHLAGGAGRAAAELTHHPDAGHQEQGGHREPPEGDHPAEPHGPCQGTDPAHHAAHQKADRHHRRGPYRGEHGEDQGQAAQDQHHHPFGQGEGAQGVAVAGKAAGLGGGRNQIGDVGGQGGVRSQTSGP